MNMYRLLWQWLWCSLHIMQTSKQSHLWMHKEIRSPAVTQYPQEKPPTNERQTVGSQFLRQTSGVQLHITMYPCLSPTALVGSFSHLYQIQLVFHEFQLELPCNLSQGGHNHDRRPTLRAPCKGLCLRLMDPSPVRPPHCWNFLE